MTNGTIILGVKYHYFKFTLIVYVYFIVLKKNPPHDYKCK